MNLEIPPTFVFLPITLAILIVAITQVVAALLTQTAHQTFIH